MHANKQNLRTHGRMVVLLACAASLTYSSAFAQSAKVVTFWKAPHHAQEAELWQPIIDEFQKQHPDVKIEHVVTPWATWQEQYSSAFASDSPPCVSYMPDSYGTSFIFGNKLVDLSDAKYADQVKDGYGPNWKAANFGGIQAGIPFAGAPTMWMYNKDIFDKAKVAYPKDDWTFDDFKNTLKALKDAGVEVPANIPTGGFAGGGFQGYLPFLWSMGGDLLTKDQKAPAANSPEAVAALKFVKSLFDEGLVAPVGSYTHLEGEDLFVRGGMAMDNMVAEYLGTLRSQAPDLHYGIVRAPKGPALQANFGNWGFFALSKDCKAKDEAFEFMKFITSKENTEKYLGAVGLYPARTDTTLFADKPEEKQFLAGMQYNKNVPIVPKGQELIDVFFREIEGALTGQVTPEEASENAQQAMQAIIK
ncbi:sugar ABC transporter substrate-binding protein [Rhizobium sp. X9]|uniref:ABC transporter substrate-binding protein n=1 Tax=Rhizobium sp. X9 TaxID=2815360 RepID=UPI001C0D546F|nr:sugar ABC transporter substrate-binding protein [Rhizobium sp. X9]